MELQPKETLDLYDAELHRTGETITRGDMIPQGKYIYVISIMTMDAAGNILLTRRAPEKTHARRWEITGGCVQSGETPYSAAVRELFEETGIHAAEQELQSCGYHIREESIHWFFLLRKNVQLEDIRLQPGETDAAKWVSPQQLADMMLAGETIAKRVPLIFSHYAEIFKGCSIDRSNEEKEVIV